MYKIIHIFFYGIGAFVALYVLFQILAIVLGVAGLTAWITAKKVDETVTLATYPCDGGELQLVHKLYTTSPDHFYETLLFNYKKGNIFSKVSSITYDSYEDSYGWVYEGFPTYYLSKDTYIKKLPGFTLDYKKERAWNIFIEDENINFSDFSECIATHAEDIDTLLKSFSTSKGKDSSPLKLNMVTNYHDKNVIWFTQKEETTIPGYKVTMVKQGDVYQPKVDKIDYNNEPDKSNLNLFGHEWYIYQSKTQDVLPTVEDLRTSKNKRGETLGEYIDNFENSLKLLSEPNNS